MAARAASRDALRWLAPIVGAMLAASATPARPQSVEAFYRGKTIQLVVPADPGGSYDLHSRLIARYIGRWIPGHPTVIVQAMAGAGGLRAINYLYEKAAQDGSVIGMPIQENILADVLGGPDVRYDAAKFNWIGRVASSADVIVAWHTYGAKTIADATRVAIPLGATGPASGAMLYAMMLNSLIGTRFDIIPGYKHNEMLLAMERGETGAAHTSCGTLRTAFPNWLADKKVNVLVSMGSERLSAIADVPALVELGTTTEERQVLAIFASAETIGRSILTPPHVPSERVATLRQAFDAMLKDRDFLDEIGKAETEYAPMSGTALQGLIEGTRDVPSSALALARASMHR
jgi:tripartite-type tricarboxylate transporter receptor subunit TctC